MTSRPQQPSSTLSDIASFASGAGSGTVLACQPRFWIQRSTLCRWSCHLLFGNQHCGLAGISGHKPWRHKCHSFLLSAGLASQPTGHLPTHTVGLKYVVIDEVAMCCSEFCLRPCGFLLAQKLVSRLSCTGAIHQHGITEYVTLADTDNEGQEAQHARLDENEIRTSEAEV